MQISWEEYDRLAEYVNLSKQNSIETIKTKSFLFEKFSCHNHEQYDISVDDTVIGYIMFDTDGLTLNINSIEIDVEYRGHGIATQVIEEIADYCKVHTIIGTAVASSIGFWNRFGADISQEYSMYDEDYLIPFKFSLVGH